MDWVRPNIGHNARDSGSRQRAGDREGSRGYQALEAADLRWLTMAKGTNAGVADRPTQNFSSHQHFEICISSVFFRSHFSSDMFSRSKKRRRSELEHLLPPSYVRCTCTRVRLKTYLQCSKTLSSYIKTLSRHIYNVVKLYLWRETWSNNRLFMDSS